MSRTNVGSLTTDASLPRLGDALDPAIMLDAFRTHLRSPGPRIYEVRRCRVSRIRYRENFRCILQYALRVAERTTGAERDLLVSGAMYAETGKAERRWRKLLADDPVREMPESLLTFEPVSYIPELGMLVQVFPHDRRLPTLPVLAAGPPPEMEPLLLARLGPGNWLSGTWEAEPVRYREQLGAVLKYGVRAREAATGVQARASFYAKVYRDASGERTMRQIRALRSALGPGEGPTIGAPVAYLDDLRTLVLEEAPGASLEEVLLRDLDITATVRRVARDLASFNQLDVVPERRHTLEDHVSSLERSGRLLGCACPPLGAEIDAVVSSVADGLREVPPRPTHRDLKPDHIFLDGDRTVFIDLDSFAGADPILDPALLLARLAAMPDLLPVPPARARAAARALAEEYFARVPYSWRETLHLHYAGALLEVAHGFFRRQEPGWPEKIANLVREAGDSLKRENRR